MTWTIVQTFAHRIEAEIAKGYLEENGIAALIQADDAGGMRPDLAFMTGIRLLVETRHAARARELLDGLEDDPPA
jgi:hypothetical protein